MKLALWIAVFLMGPFSFAEIGPLQAEQLANRCQTYQYFLTGAHLAEQIGLEQKRREQGRVKIEIE
ncbi:MAG: hypothetical protein ACAH59_05725 [Pseudobdellovibrionaceae bacterium]